MNSAVIFLAAALAAALAALVILLLRMHGRELSAQEERSKMEREFEEQADLISDMQQKIISGMAEILENRDGSTGGHVKRTSHVVRLLTKAMLEDSYPRVNSDFTSFVAVTAPLHDLGKISIPDSVLCNPGKLTEEEFGTMKGHTVKGEALVWRFLNGLEILEVIEIAGNIARNHHEWWNGKGYPDQLVGEEIPLEARIMAIADVYDALVSKRVYKDPMPYDKAYEIIDGAFGTQFDPSLKKYFDLCRKDIEAFYDKQK